MVFTPRIYGSKLAPEDTLDDIPGLTAIYMRLTWAHLEPEEGQFCWSDFDTPAQRFIDKGKKIAIRISCADSTAGDFREVIPYATPQWVEKTGARGYRFNVPGLGKPSRCVSEDGDVWEPDYNDPVFLEKLDHFLAAFAARYDGNPNVAFIDVGSFGVWGEGHTCATTRKIYPAEVVKKHIDLYRKHFKKTLLVINDDYSLMKSGLEAIEHGRKLGCALRDDSILVYPYRNAAMAQDFWPTRPVILECGHYDLCNKRKSWGDGSGYLNALEDYHASYVSIHWWPREFQQCNKDLMKKMSLRLGYRLQLVEASWPNKIETGVKWPVSLEWRNAGVAPLYQGGYPALTLKNAKGGIVAVLAAENANLGTLPVGSPGAAESRKFQQQFCLADWLIKPGEYDVFVSVGDRMGTPEIALPLPEADGHRRYKIGKIKVAARQATP